MKPKFPRLRYGDNVPIALKFNSQRLGAEIGHLVVDAPLVTQGWVNSVSALFD
jgi:hypothetical protein